MEECTVCALHRSDGGGCRWGCGVESSCGRVEEVEDQDLKDVSAGVGDVGGYYWDEKEGEEGVGDVKGVVVRFSAVGC